MLRSEEFKSVNAKIIQALHSAGVPLNEIWLQSRCICEYCKVDLLRDPQTYRGAESDHILPQSLYPRLILDLSNYAMACASCHKLKGRLDVGRDAPGLKEVDSLPPALRASLIGKVKAELESLRRQQDVQLETIRELLASCGWRSGTNSHTNTVQAERSPEYVAASEDEQH